MRTFDGIDLYVDIDGPEDAASPPVTLVLVHCWAVDSGEWCYQTQALRRRWRPDELRIVTYDHRGHGRSGATSRRDATVANLGRDLRDLIRQVAPTGPLVLAGHSIGGMALMALAELDPELVRSRVRGAAFLSTSAGELDRVTLGMPEVGPVVKHQIPRALALRSHTLSRRQRLRAPIIETLVARHLLFGRPMRLRDQAAVVEGIVSVPAATMSGFFDDLMSHRRYASLAVYADLPTRVLVGTRDRLTPVDHAAHLAARLPGSDLRELADAGHMLPLERPDEVTAALCELLEPVLASCPS